MDNSEQKNKKWSTDECIVLVALYSVLEFSIGDDERSENRLIATIFGRKFAAVDRQWRNIKDYMERLPDKNISSEIKYWADVSIDDLQLLMRLAKFICDKNDWNSLKDLLDE